jgi:hypothetical protein
MNKPPTVVEIPQNASDHVVRLQIEEVPKTIKQARPKRTERVVVTIQQAP